MCGSVHRVEVPPRPEVDFRSLELELKTVVWMLKIKHWSSARAARDTELSLQHPVFPLRQDLHI